ncbi:Cytosolic acyl coenzyme A thioester hydrolase [Plecturocebus cupreus]
MGSGVSGSVCPCSHDGSTPLPTTGQDAEKALRVGGQKRWYTVGGAKKLTNKATLWYVPLSLKNVDKVLEVPPVVVRCPSASLLGADGRDQVTLPDSGRLVQLSVPREQLARAGAQGPGPSAGGVPSGPGRASRAPQEFLSCLRGNTGGEETCLCRSFQCVFNSCLECECKLAQNSWT